MPHKLYQHLPPSLYSVRAPSVDVRTVGAGGGSIASVAEITGAIRVGPESAGALPGPVCYNKGGTRPTVTDAFAVLGYLPYALLGGSFHLDIDAALEAMEKNIVKPMKLTSAIEAAEGIIRITLEKIYGSLRSVSVEKGKDPRDYHLVSFGGAGGLVACELAKVCGVKYPIIIPPSPGGECRNPRLFREMLMAEQFYVLLATLALVSGMKLRLQ